MTRDRSENSLPPVQRLYVYLTEGCNLACRHCWLAPRFDPGGDRYATLPVEAFETAVREALPLGLHSVKLTGGEPLLHPEFDSLLEILDREELSITLETNGVLLTEEKAKKIAHLERRHVAVSIDGEDAATHDAIRGVEGAFEGAVRAVRLLAEVDTPPQIIFSLFRCNADQLEAVVRMAEEAGASSVKFNIVQPTGRGEGVVRRDEHLPVPEVVALGRWVDRELAPRTRLPLFFDHPMAFRALSRIASGEGAGACGILSIMGLLATGHWALCGIGMHHPGMVFGEVGAEPLARVWAEAPTLQRLREGLPDALGGVCGRCLVRGRCLGGCVAQNYHRTGDLLAPFWFCEEAEALGIFPASRLETAAPVANRRQLL